MARARARVRGRLWRRHIEHVPELPVAKPAEPPPLKRGGTPKHTRWFRVLAMVRKPEGLAYDFVAEAKTASEAMVVASRYSHRAVVTDWHSKVLFNNWKPIEKESHRVE
jgi:hypothetical protein